MRILCMSNIKINTLFNGLITALVITVPSSILNAAAISDNVAPAIQEPSGIYNTGSPNLINMYVRTVIQSGPCVTGDYSGCTLNDVLNDIERNDDFSPEIKVHFSADDYPDDGLISNAELRQRGKASRLAPQKSFRVKLDKNIPSPLWRGERRLQLNKSPWERTRILQKLSYDLFVDMPHLPSMRTQFARLTMEDQGNTEDLGLFTQIEHFGKEYLERRGWDKDSRVYKPKYFWYQNSPAFALDSAGKPIDLVAFEKIIEIKRGKTHNDFFNMVQAVNDRSNNFETDVINKHFNRDNYLSWLAVNILTNNTDTTAKNFYFYNPKNSDDFYFVPWDYDYAWGENYTDINHLPRWWFSHGNWWSTKFHKRFLQIPGNLELLKSAVSEVRNNYLSVSKINAKKDRYYDIVFPVIRNSPDWNHISLGGGSSAERVAAYNQIFSDLSNNVEFNYARFLERADDPMPFDIYEPEFLSNHDIRFKWEASESLSGQTIVYELDVATTKEFTAGTILEHVTNIATARHTLHWRHPKGTYFYRIIARDSNNPQQNWQISSESVLNYSNGDDLFGVKQITVTQDGDTTNPPPPPPPSGAISNPVATITVNGNSSDWSGTTAFATDPDDIGGGSGNVIDWQNATIAHNDQNVFMLYRNRGPVDPNRTSGSYTSWGWQAFMDTDNNPNTGFKLNDSFGADYLLEANELQRYIGTGNNWSWQGFAGATSRFNGNIDEISFSRSFIGNPQSMRIIFQGANQSYGGNTVDVYPDSGYLSYAFGTVTPPTNQAPIAANQSISVVVNSNSIISLNATDADGDSLTASVTQQPIHGSVVIGSGLTVQYTPNQNYTGADSFRYRVNDGTVNSNTATVSINVVNDNPGTGTSNPVVSGGITVNGSRSDWNALTLFANDPDDITGASNTIDWLRAGLAHNNDTVYLMYQNRGNVDQSNTSGSFLPWGWQTFLDTDSNSATGYQLNGSMGADYMIEGQHVFRYNGSGWNWTSMGTATSRFNNTIAELSFPRSWIGSHSNVQVAFLGNNEAFGGSSIDEYPSNGSFEYYFGGGSAGRATPVASNQSGVLNSPQNHQPNLNTTDVNNGNGTATNSGGGSFSWWLLIPSLLLLRRRLLTKTHRSN